MNNEDQVIIRAIAAEIAKLLPDQRALCEADIKEIAAIVLRDGHIGRLALAMVGASAAAAD